VLWGWAANSGLGGRDFREDRSISGKEGAVRKLTVKNFSVIKEAELEFGKITVLIGPLASGKSLLCKLAYFLSKETLEHAVVNILRDKTLEEFRSTIIGIFLNRFSTGAISESPYLAEFTEGKYTVKFFGKYETHDGEIGCVLSSEFEELYSALRTKNSANRPIGENSILSLEGVVRTELNLLLTDPVVLRSFYIPAGRSFFTNTSKGIRVLRNPDIDPLVGDFAEMVRWNTPRQSQFLSEEAQRTAYETQIKMVEIASGHVEGTPDSPVFVSKDNRHIPFPLLSSGTQELLPLFNVLGQLAWDREGRIAWAEPKQGQQVQRAPISAKALIYLEEPEAHIFPETQYQLVRLFAWLSNVPSQDFSWVITTHSPYILSSFNNLLEAWQVAVAKPDSRSEIAKLIEERYWIAPSDFRAYCIDDGKLESIMDEETGLINGNYLDGVSNEIGSQFDELLRIGYVKA
jgi:hypothetical protein